MIDDVNATINLDKDECWARVLARFAAIETQLQELYWEVLDCMNEDEQPRLD
jgi:hypothetical protein